MDFKIELPSSVDNAVQNITDEPTKKIGSIIKDALYLRFGSVSYKADKRRILEKYGLIEFENRLQNCINRIPLEKLVTPDYQTLMLAIDNLEPCLNSEDLRNLFSNLIARSCNCDYKNLIHPSFSEMLHQMSPYDAKILNFFVTTKPERFITYTFLSKDGKSFDRVPYMFDTYPEPNEADYISIAISSLMRLGILAFHDDALVTFADDSPFVNSEFYKCCEKERVQQCIYWESRITAQVCKITPLGNSFISACFD